MDYLILSLKIVMALGAVYLAFASVAVETRSPDTTQPWHKRINRYGIAAIVVATVVFIAAAGVEYLNAKGDTEKAAQISKLLDHIAALTKDLAISKQLTNEAAEQVKGLSAELDLSREARDSGMTTIGRGRISFVDWRGTVATPTGGKQIVDRTGRRDVLTVQGGDIIIWQMTCPRGETAWRAEQPEQCLEGVLGAMKDHTGVGFFVDAMLGQTDIPGAHAAGPLQYQEPTGHCAPVADAMKAQRCYMDVQHIVSGGTLAQRAIAARGYGIRRGTASADFCRSYEILHKQPCPKPE